MIISKIFILAHMHSFKILTFFFSWIYINVENNFFYLETQNNEYQVIKITFNALICISDYY